jgi:hypothetical protein
MITGEMIKAAETRYSRNRVKAIEDEWRENYPYISDCVSLLKGMTERFDLIKIKNASDEYFSVNQSAILSNPPDTPFGRAVKEYNTDMSSTSLIKQILIVLYEVGVIGIKISGGTKVNYAYLHHETFSAEQITELSSFSVHSTFHKALQINVNSRNNS